MIKPVISPSRAVLAAVLGASLALSGCSQSADDSAPTAQASSRTLAALIADNGDFSIVANTMQDSGLAEVFDGNAAYTVLVPTDQAFAALGSEKALLDGDDQRAVRVAILRDHIFPGAFTPEDIGSAIDAANGGSVVMKSMGGHDLTFTRSDGAVTVTSSDGSSAQLVNAAMPGANGVAIPVNGVLKDLTAAGE